jgi:hypothetical protein
MPSKQATRRVPVLLTRIKEFIANINSDLNVLGILANRTHGMDLTYDEESRLGLLRDQCKEVWGEPVRLLSTHIPRSVVLRDAEDEQRPLRSGEALFDQYAALAREIESLMPIFCRPKVVPAKEPVG